MAVSPAEVRGIVERVCARPDVLDACARHDLGTVISALGTGGLTQGRIAELTGIPQGRLSEWNTGKRKPKGVTTFQKFANGVGLPPAARRALGLDAGTRAVAVTASSASPDVSYPDTLAKAVRNVSRLWIADLSDAGQGSESCHARARTGGKLRSPAVTHGHREQLPIWAWAG
jgi:transcriptional regulator with XRE-family HTH domain